MTKLLGTAKAKELIFTGKRLDGIEAERIGLVNLCAREPSRAIDGALGMAKQILTSGAPFLPFSNCFGLRVWLTRSSAGTARS